MSYVESLEKQLEAERKAWEGADTDRLRQRRRADELQEQLKATQKALADAVDVAIWLTGLPCLNQESEAWPYWESGARPKLYKAMELLDSNSAYRQERM